MYLSDNIRYATRDSSLVIIVKKDSEGHGGNLYVNPSVTKIDATIITDGALMNGVLSH